MLTLFGHHDSGHAYKVRLMLTITGIEHGYRWIDIFADRDQRPDDFKTHARYHEVPLLVDGNEAFVQSGAILLHLAQQFQCCGGEDPRRLKLCREWLMWEANKIGMCLPQLRALAKFKDPSINEGAYQWLAGRYDHDVNLIDEALSDGRPWVVPGEEPSIADFSLCGYLMLADEANVVVPNGVANWLNRIRALPGWASCQDLMAATADSSATS